MIALSVIVVMSADPGAGHQATDLTPDPLGYKLLSPVPITRAPLGIISDQMLQLSFKVLRSPGCHAMLVRWG